MGGGGGSRGGALSNPQLSIGHVAYISTRIRKRMRVPQFAFWRHQSLKPQVHADFDYMHIYICTSALGHSHSVILILMGVYSILMTMRDIYIFVYSFCY